MSPTARTLKYLRENGYIADVVERTIPGAFVKKDLFGCIDVVAVFLQNEPHVLFVQCTSGSNVSSRVRKTAGMDAVQHLRRAGARVEVWGWAKTGPRGKRKLWTRRVVSL